MYAIGEKNGKVNQEMNGVHRKQAVQPPSTGAKDSMTDCNGATADSKSKKKSNPESSIALTTQMLLDEINRRRERSGLQHLKVKQELTKSATIIAQENAKNKTESDLGKVVEDVGYAYRSIAQRGLSTCSKDAKYVVDSFLKNSDDVISDKFTEVGIAIAFLNDKEESHTKFIIGHFARPKPKVSPPSKELEQEIAALKKSMDQVDSEIENLRDFLRVSPPSDVDEYNRLVNKTNAKGRKFQELQDTYNAKVKEHGRQVREYNHQISES